MIWGDGTTYEGQWKEGNQEGLGKLQSRFGVQLGIFKNNKFIKDHKFMFDGIQTGQFGEFKKSNLRVGALNIQNQ